jgi:hypothetical protein
MSRVTALVAASLLFSFGCGQTVPTTPPGPAQALANSRLSGPLRTFTFSPHTSFPVSHYTTLSSLRLYDNGAFALDYSSGSYTGTYAERDGAVLFTWDAGSAGGAWGAAGTVSGDALTVRYNMVMQLSDFEDALYVRAR